MSSLSDGSIDDLIAGWSQVYGISIMILSCAINFIILTLIFTITMYFRQRKRGTLSLMEILLQGILQGLVASILILVIDVTTGGFASLLMFAVYPIVFVVCIILAIISPLFLQDDPGRISGYRIWMVSFWPIFIVGMIVALSLGAFVTYMGVKFSGIIMNLLNEMVYKISLVMP